MTNTTTETKLATLERVTAEARIIRMSINMNMFHMARVLVEAKEVVPHGEWLAWIRENADVSEKTAEDMMAAYRRFKDRPEIQQLAPSKTFKLLALPAGAEDAFMEQNDVENMTVRQIAEAVKKARAEEQAKAQEIIDREREQREAAEERARELASRPAAEPEGESEELREARAQTQHFANMARDLNTEKVELERKLKAEQDAKEAAEQRHEAEEERQIEKFNKLRDEYLNYKSTVKRGESSGTQSDELTLDVFTAAVREFTGLCARMPYMSEAFMAMPEEERQKYNVLLQAVEGWAEGARRAIDSYVLEGVVLDVQ